MATRFRHGIVVFGLFAAFLGGCAGGDSGVSEREARAQEGRALFGGGSESSASASDGARSGDTLSSTPGWGIVLQSFPGEPSSETITQARTLAQRELGRSDVRVMRQQSGAAIVLGSYEGPESAAAKRDLDAARRVVVGGRMIYGRAFLAPPPRTIDYGDHPQYNLSTVKAAYGRDAIWTFQIGVYESPNRQEAKQAAERAVVDLRREGEQAFYYHGPTRSMVTIGVFGRDDYDEQLGPRTPVLHALKEKYPLNLLNGQYPIIEKRPGVEDRRQSSLLVRIPD